MRCLRLSLLLLTACLACACGTTPVRSTVVPPYASRGFNSTSAPVDITFEENGIGPREGHSKARSVFWLFSWGDASVATAARNGSISVVDHIDCRLFNVIFGFYQSYETIVYGR